MLKLIICLPVFASQYPDPTLRGRGASPDAFQMAVTPDRNAKKSFFAFLNSPMIIYYGFVIKVFGRKCTLNFVLFMFIGCFSA